MHVVGEGGGGMVGIRYMKTCMHALCFHVTYMYIIVPGIIIYMHVVPIFSRSPMQFHY